MAYVKKLSQHSPQWSKIKLLLAQLRLLMSLFFFWDCWELHRIGAETSPCSRIGLSHWWARSLFWTPAESASSAFSKESAVTAWKELMETDNLEIWQLFSFFFSLASRMTRSQQAILILYSNPNESHPRASIFWMFEEDLRHTQILRIYVGIP